MRAEDLVRGVVRIWAEGAPGEDDSIVGTGFLVAPDLVVTCAHVAARAWGTDPGSDAGLGRTVRLDFPASAPLEFHEATVVLWLPRRPTPGGAYDLAGVRLERSAPAGAKPLPLVVEDSPWGRPCKAFGFPAGRPDGAYAAGELRDVLANGWLLVKGGAEAREFTRPGYSGGPVVTDAGVVGLLTEGDRDVRVREAVMVPVRTILAAWPALEQALSRSPYPGLAAFDADDAPFFHGRDAVSADLAAALEAPPHLVVVAGPSGSGKSSLLAAGLLPRMSESWSTARWAPGKAPYAALARALLSALHPDADELRLSVESARLARDLDSGSVRLEHVLAQDPTARWVIAVDQPEELVLDANGADPGTATVPPARRLFEALLAAHADERLAGRLALVIAVRTDDLDALLRMPQLAARGGGEVVRYLGAVEDLRVVIEEPLRQAGFVGLEPGLTDRLLADVADVPNPLPLLQFTLAELWRNQHAGRLTHAAYDDIGGVRRAIANHAERMVASFGEDDLAAARDVLLQLGRPGLGDVVARRAARFDELGERGKLLVPRLAAGRLVVTDSDADGVERVEVAHEALFEHWPRLKAWWQESAAFRRWQESMRFALRAWREGGEDPGDLLHGPRLRAAEAHLRDRPGAFTAAELAYVMRSGERELEESEAASAGLKRQLRLRRRLNLVLAVGLAVAAGLAAVTITQISSVRQLRAETERLLHSATEATGALGALTAELEESLGESRAVLATRLGIQAVAMSTAPTTFGGDMRLAALMASHAVRLDPGPEAYDRLLRVLQAHPTYRATLDAAATAVALGPDGRSVVVGRGDGSLLVFDGVTGARVGQPATGHVGPVTAVAFAPGGVIVSGGTDGRLVEWRLAQGLQRIGSFSEARLGPVTAVAATSDGGGWLVADAAGTLTSFSTAGEVLAVVDERGPVVVSAGDAGGAADAGGTAAGDASTVAATVARDVGIPVAASAIDGTDESALAAREAWTALLTVHPSRPVAAVARGSAVTVVDATTLRRLWSLPLAPEAVAAIAFNADGTDLVVATVDGRLHAYDTSRGGQGPFDSWVSRIGDPRAMAPDTAPTRVLVGAGDGTARWVDYRQRDVATETLSGHDQPLAKVLVGGELIVTVSTDGRVVTWDHAPRHALGGHVTHLEFLPRTATLGPSGAWLYVGGGGDGALALVDVVSGDVTAQVTGTHGGEVWDIAASADGSTLVTVGRDGRLDVRDPVTLELIATPFEYDKTVVHVSEHPTEDAWVVGANHGLVTSVARGSGALTTLRAASSGWSPGAIVAVSSDGASLAVALEDRIELWRGGALIASGTTGSGRNVLRLQFAPGDELLLSSGSGAVTLWSVPTLEQVARWIDKDRAAISPDGTLLAMSDWYGVLRLYDVATLRQLGMPLQANGDPLVALEFNRDGTVLLTLDAAGDVMSWRTSPASWLQSACAMAWRDLSGDEVARFMSAETFEPVCPS